MALADETFRLIAVAQALVSTMRHIDLSGLQQQVGMLCAKALDLPYGRTGLIRAELQRLLTRLDELHATMRENAA